MEEVPSHRARQACHALYAELVRVSLRKSPDHILQRNLYLQLHLRLLSETLHLFGSSIIGAGRYDDCHGTLTVLRHETVLYNSIRMTGGIQKQAK